MRIATQLSSALVMVAGISALTGCSMLGSHGQKIGDAPRPAFAESGQHEQGEGDSSAQTGLSSRISAQDPYATSDNPDPKAYDAKPTVVLTTQSIKQCKGLTLSRGDTIALRLPANPSTGLAWQMDARPDSLRLLTPPRTEQPSDSDPKTIAQANTTVVYDWRFEASSRGHGTLRMLYHDANQQQHAPASVFKCAIRVK